VGFVRYDVPVEHPSFGKPIPCANPVHQPARLERLAAVSGLHGDDLNISLDDIRLDPGNRDMVTAAREVLDDYYGWIYLWGGPGNAKTVVLKAMINAANQAGRGPAMYTSFTTLVNWMRDSFREQKAKDADPFANMGYIERFERIKAIPFLAIDEMDKARSTEFADEFRFSFLDERYQQALRGETVTVFASNSSPGSLPPALMDRVRDGRFKVIQVTTPSFRPGMQR
jgi:DNA replication protein DnaC